jgi:hypothetical protein
MQCRTKAGEGGGRGKGSGNGCALAFLVASALASTNSATTRGWLTASPVAATTPPREGSAHFALARRPRMESQYNDAASRRTICIEGTPIRHKAPPSDGSQVALIASLGMRRAAREFLVAPSWGRAMLSIVLSTLLSIAGRSCVTGWTRAKRLGTIFLDGFSGTPSASYGV